MFAAATASTCPTQPLGFMFAGVCGGVLFYSKAMVILAVLASVQLEHTEGITPQMPSKHVLLRTQANGLCFWSCAWLFLKATPSQLLGWHTRQRNATGFPSSEESEMEKNLVFEWATSLPDMPEACRNRLLQHHSAENEDIDPSLFC